MDYEQLTDSTHTGTLFSAPPEELSGFDSGVQHAQAYDVLLSLLSAGRITAEIRSKICTRLFERVSRGAGSRLNRSVTFSSPGLYEYRTFF